MLRSQCLAVMISSMFGLGMCNAAVVVRQVISSTDDAEEHLTEGNTIDFTSTDLELGAEGGGTDTQEIGIRFQNLDIPVGSVIQSAFIQFTVDETDTEDTSVRIFGELSVDPLTYAGDAFNITSRTKTNSFVDWDNIPIWDTVGAAGADQRTPDIASLVQEIINQPGWTANNAMAFMLTANPGGERTGESFDGDPAAAPVLTITFVPEPSAFFMVGLVVSMLATSRRRCGC